MIPLKHCRPAALDHACRWSVNRSSSCVSRLRGRGLQLIPAVPSKTHMLQHDRFTTPSGCEDSYPPPSLPDPDTFIDFKNKYNHQTNLQPLCYPPISAPHRAPTRSNPRGSRTPARTITDGRIELHLVGQRRIGRCETVAQQKGIGCLLRYATTTSGTDRPASAGSRSRGALLGSETGALPHAGMPPPHRSVVV